METKKELSEISNNWRVIPGLESYAINENGDSKSTGISSSDIVKCAKGKKLNKQYIWKYKENL